MTNEQFLEKILETNRFRVGSENRVLELAKKWALLTHLGFYYDEKGHRCSMNQKDSDRMAEGVMLLLRDAMKGMITDEISS